MYAAVRQSDRYGGNLPSRKRLRKNANNYGLFEEDSFFDWQPVSMVFLFVCCCCCCVCVCQCVFVCVCVLGGGRGVFVFAFVFRPHAAPRGRSATTRHDTTRRDAIRSGAAPCTPVSDLNPLSGRYIHSKKNRLGITIGPEQWLRTLVSAQ